MTFDKEKLLQEIEAGGESLTGFVKTHTMLSSVVAAFVVGFFFGAFFF